MTYKEQDQLMDYAKGCGVILLFLEYDKYHAHVNGTFITNSLWEALGHITQAVSEGHKVVRIMEEER